MSFYLVCMVPSGEDGFREEAMPDHGPYETGPEAAAMAKSLTATLGRKVQPRRIAQAGPWRDAVPKLVAQHKLVTLPEAWDLAPIADHYAHLTDGDPPLIAYIENETHGAMGRFTRIRPGAYLSRYYPHLSDAESRRLVAKVSPGSEIFFARTPEEIVEVYRDGPSSCMAKPDSFWEKLPHPPIWVYGAGDLAVAYQRNRQGRIQSRAVCWPDKNQYGRVYGDDSRLKQALEAEGYEQVTTFVGARLLKIPVHRVKSQSLEHHYLSPYFDNIDYLIDNGDHFLTATGPIPSGIGYCEGGSVTQMMVLCPQTGRTVGFADTVPVEVEDGRIERWSLDGSEGGSVTCHGTGRLVARRVAIRIDGVFWSPSARAERNGRPSAETTVTPTLANQAAA